MVQVCSNQIRQGYHDANMHLITAFYTCVHVPRDATPVCMEYMVCSSIQYKTYMHTKLTNKNSEQHYTVSIDPSK